MINSPEDLSGTGERRKWKRIPLVDTGQIVGALFGIVMTSLTWLAFEHSTRNSQPSTSAAQPRANMAPRYSAIANFGVLPIDQPEQWLVARDKAGNDLGTLPVAPGELVLRSEKEPELHAPDYVGAPWTITFK